MLSSSRTFAQSDDDHWSGDDLPHICGIQSVKDHLGCSPSDVHPGGHYDHSLQ